mgnify:CR=1 FL=1
MMKIHGYSTSSQSIVHLSADNDEMTALVNNAPTDIWTAVQSAIRDGVKSGELEGAYMHYAVETFKSDSVGEMTLVENELRINTDGAYALKITVTSPDAPKLDTRGVVSALIKRAALEHVLEWSKMAVERRSSFGHAVLQHVFIDRVPGEGWLMIATDGYRLLKIQTPFPYIYARHGYRALLRPDTALKALKHMPSGVITWRETPRFIALEDDDTRHVMYRLDHEIPNYQSVLETNERCSVVVRGVDLNKAVKSTLRRVEAIHRVIVMAIDGESLTVAPERGGEAGIACEILSKDGKFPESELRFDGRYLNDFIRLTSARADVHIRVKDNTSPIRLTLSNRPELEYYVMPIPRAAKRT